LRLGPPGGWAWQGLTLHSRVAGRLAWRGATVQGVWCAPCCPRVVSPLVASSCLRYVRFSTTMSAITTAPARFPHRWRTVVVVSAVVALVVAGCSVPSNKPSAYGPDVRANFIEGCTGDIPETGGTTTTLASTSYCECAYEVFVEVMPYNDDARKDSAYAGYPSDAPTFTRFNDELSKADDPAAVWASLPERVREELDRCSVGDGPLAPTTVAPSAE